MNENTFGSRLNVIEFGEHFSEPLTISEGLERVLKLNQELHTISQQLADKRRKEKLNQTSDEYANWRLKASYAKSSKMLQVQKLNLWVQNQRAKYAAEAIGSQNPVAIISELIDLIQDMRQRARIPLSHENLNLVALATDIVNNYEVNRQ